MILTIPLTEIKIEDGSHLIASVWINGFIARMIIDTGATETIFDEKRILSYMKGDTVKTVNGRTSSGLGADTMKIGSTVFDKLQIGELRLYDYKATTMNLDSISRAYVNLKEKPVEGILGSDFLKEHEALISYPVGKMFLKI